MKIVYSFLFLFSLTACMTTGDAEQLDELQGLKNEMTEMYGIIVRNADFGFPWGGLHEKIKQLQVNQKHWEENELVKCKTTACLRSVYQERLAFLENKYLPHVDGFLSGDFLEEGDPGKGYPINRRTVSGEDLSYFADEQWVGNTFNSLDRRQLIKNQFKLLSCDFKISVAVGTSRGNSGYALICEASENGKIHTIRFCYDEMVGKNRLERIKRDEMNFIKMGKFVFYNCFGS